MNGIPALAECIKTTVSPQQSAWNTLWRLKPFLDPYRARVLIAAAALLIAAGATLAIPLAFRLLIDRGFSVPDSMGESDVNGVFLTLFAVAVLLALATAVRFYCVSWLGDRITADLRKQVFSQVLKQDPVFLKP